MTGIKNYVSDKLTCFYLKMLLLHNLNVSKVRMLSKVSSSASITIMTAAVVVGLTSVVVFKTLRNSRKANLTKSKVNKSTWLGDEIMMTLDSIVDTFLPEISDEDLDENGIFMIDEALSHFWPNLIDCSIFEDGFSLMLEDPRKRALLKRGASNLGVSEKVAEAMGVLLLKEDRDQLSVLLKLLSTSPGNFFLTCFPSPFHKLSLNQRETALRRLRDSYIPQLRSAYQAFKRLTGGIFSSYPFHEVTVDGTVVGTNPAWLAIGYDPKSTVSKDSCPQAALKVPLPIPVEVPSSSSKKRIRYMADVVVIGSGAGGGTVAAKLVQAGYTVLVLEKGPYYSTQQFKEWTEATAMEKVYERGGLCASKDGNIVILAGACVGGGTTVNWSASFRTPDYVRREWAKTVPEVFGDKGPFEKALDDVHEMFSVNTEFTHVTEFSPCSIHDVEGARSSSSYHKLSGSAKDGSQKGGYGVGYHLSKDSYDSADSSSPSGAGDTHTLKTKDARPFIKNLNNELLAKGATACGYFPESIPRNATGCIDCGHCCHGCPYGAKKSTITSQLQPLASSGRLFLIPNCFVDSIIIDGSSKSATGVLATIDDNLLGRKESIEIVAKIVVSACGALHTPALLLRSGLNNRNIGRHLALHPVCGVAGLFSLSDLQKLYPVVSSQPAVSLEAVSTGLDSGISMGIVVRSDASEKDDSSKKAAKLYGKELSAELTRESTHGIWQSCPAIQTPPLHPGMLGLVMPWNGGLGFKACMLLYRQMAGFIGITRDLSTYHNRIRLSSEGQPIIDYTLTRQDELLVLEGLEKQLRIMRAAGAKVMFPLHESSPWIDNMEDKIFEARLLQMRKEGIQKSKMQMFSAHQLGSCRMAASAEDGCVRPSGETFEISCLYVADGSILPTSLGINPMLTIEAFAVMIAERIEKRLKENVKNTRA